MDGKFQGLLNCTAQNGGDHVSNGAVTSSTPQSTSAPPSGRSQNSDSGRHSGVTNPVLTNNQQRRDSRSSPPVPPRKNPPPPPPPRDGHPRWHSMKENNSNNSATRGSDTICNPDNSNVRRASDSKALSSTSTHPHQTINHSHVAQSESNVHSSSPKKHRKSTPVHGHGHGHRREDSRPSDFGSLDAVASSDFDHRESFSDFDSEFGSGFIPLSPEYEQSKLEETIILLTSPETVHLLNEYDTVTWVSADILVTHCDKNRSHLSRK